MASVESAIPVAATSSPLSKEELRRMLKIVRTLLNYDRLYLGGGNAARIDFDLPSDVAIVSNEAGITGGVRLWEPRLDRFFR